ncbi:polysaccharide deacetylase family protein [Heyndrickxia sp. MSNUG]|uniref:polysaccharide deacetylase family protein n=1 Tax=Heyndrickxia sp. MSNUG TaxID=3136677 RepID=UPI003C2B7CAA
MASLKKKTAKWCALICLFGGIVTSSTVVASQEKRPMTGETIKLKIQIPNPPSEIKLSNRTNEILKKVEKKSPRFAEVNEIKLENADTAVNNPPLVPADHKAPAEQTTDQKTVYLTFDDGPHKVSDQILNMLDEYDAKATFFMLDGNMRNFPDAVKRMAQDGHSLGAHGVTHDKTKIYQSPQTVVAEMNQTLNTIKEITGIDTSFIRTPYGSAPYMTDPYKKAVTDKGYQMWDWNIDSKDWYYRDHRLVDNTISQINSQAKKQEPIVILLHERQETLAQLPELLKYLKEHNYSFKALEPTMEPIQLK